MTRCTVESRNKVRTAADYCSDLPDVVAVDVLAPDVEPLREWTLEVVIDGDDVPIAVLRELTIAGLRVRDVSQRGEPPHTVVVAAA